MLNRFSYIFLLGLLALAAFLYIHFTRMSDEGQQRFTSVERCRVCHEPASTGSQFRSWQRGPHARAYASLSSDSAKAYLAGANGGAALSIDSCLSCHTTLGRPAANESEKLLLDEGVGCERCHGAGSNYSDYNTMMHRNEFTSHGGVVGSINDCYQCHARSVTGETRHCPFQRAPFDADTAWLRIRHPMIKTGRLPDTVIQLRK